MREANFQAAVADLARTAGWKVKHDPKVQTVKGDWRTQVAYDGKGWPDLVLVHPKRRRIVFAELKTDHGKLSDEQAEWGRVLRLAGAVWHVWRPRDWDQIVAYLTDGKGVAA